MTFNWIRRLFGAGYDGADRTRHRQYLPGGRRQPRQEDRMLGTSDRIRLRQECLNLRRNSGIVAGIVDRVSDNVVGSGIMPQAKTASKEWNDEAERFWKEWSKVADYRQRMTLPEIQRQIIQARMWAGDVAFVLLKNGQIQPVEAERIATPDDKRTQDNIFDGVQVDPKTGIRVGYYMAGRNSTGGVDTTKGVAYKRRENVIYCNNAIRFDQVRGIPDLAPVVNMLRDLDSLNEATIEKAKIEAFNAMVVQKDSSGGPGNLGPRTGAGSQIGSTQYEKMESGIIHYMSPGEQMAMIESKTPHGEHMNYVRLVLRLIGSAIGVPYEFLLLDFSESNFSSSRAALLQTHRTFTGWQEWLTSQFLQRLWNWRIAKAIKNGDLPPAPLDDMGRSTWYKVDWGYPEFGWIDPNAEALSEQREFNLGKKTMKDIVAKTGKDLQDVMAQKAKELDAAAQLADDLRAAHPDQDFNWTDVINGSNAGQHQKLQGTTTNMDGGVSEG